VSEKTLSRGHTWVWAVALAALAVQLLGVYLPGSAVPSETVIPNIDKVVHFLIFGVPAYLFARLTGRPALVGAIFVAHGAASEFIQGFIPGRDPDVFDFTADAVGVLVAVTLVALQKRRSGAPFRSPGPTGRLPLG